MFLKYLSAIAGAVIVPAAVSAATVDLSTLHVNGDASISGSTVELTQLAGSQAGSAYLPNAINLSTLTSFSAAFSFIAGLGNTSGADGLTFMIQNAAAGVNALGATGGGLGYGGISNSVAIEFDTFLNGGDIDGNHIGFNTNGSLTSQMASSLPFSLESGNPIFAWVEYQNDVFDFFVSDVNVRPGVANLSVGFDLDTLGSEAFFGFSAGTGSRTSPHTILSFDLTTTNTTIAPVPLPAGLPLVLSGVAFLGWVGRRKRS